MNPVEEPLTAEQQHAREAVRGLSLGPDPSYRTRMKQAFTSGEIENMRPAGGHIVPMRARPRWVMPAAWAAAAAAVIILVATMNRGSAWEVIGTQGEGIAVIDNRPVPLNHREELANAIHAGARVRVPDGCAIELMTDGNIAIEITSATDMTMPAIPGRWFNRNVSAGVQSGEVRFTTGSGFKGARLAVATPEAQVTVTGTTLAVICEPSGTCVCVLEGSVEVGGKGAEPKMIDGGMRRFVYGDGRSPDDAEMRPVERVKLAEHKALRGGMLEK